MPHSRNQNVQKAKAAIAATLMVAMASIISPPAKACDVPWLLYTDGVRLRLLSTSYSIQRKLCPCHEWEGHMSSLSIDTDGTVLTVQIHADLGNTPWWLDVKLVQYVDGRVFVTWDDTRHGDNVLTFARFQSFDAAWKDKRVRLALAPYLIQIGQTLPRLGPPAPETDEDRRRVEANLPDLDNPARHRHAKEALRRCGSASLRDALTQCISPNQRADLECILAERRIVLTEGQWELLAMSEW